MALSQFPSRRRFRFWRMCTSDVCGCDADQRCLWKTQQAKSAGQQLYWTLYKQEEIYASNSLFFNINIMFVCLDDIFHSKWEGRNEYHPHPRCWARNSITHTTATSSPNHEGFLPPISSVLATILKLISPKQSVASPLSVQTGVVSLHS